MNELYTFTEADKVFTFTVKGEFLKRCPNPEEYDLYNLMTKFKVSMFFHNPKGPAIQRLVDNTKEYWIDGKKLDAAEAEKVAHNHNFSNKLLEEIGD